MLYNMTYASTVFTSFWIQTMDRQFLDPPYSCQFIIFSLDSHVKFMGVSGYLNSVLSQNRFI